LLRVVFVSVDGTERGHFLGIGEDGRVLDMNEFFWERRG